MLTNVSYHNNMDCKIRWPTVHGWTTSVSYPACDLNNVRPACRDHFDIERQDGSFRKYCGFEKDRGSILTGMQTMTASFHSDAKGSGVGCLAMVLAIQREYHHAEIEHRSASV